MNKYIHCLFAFLFIFILAKPISAQDYLVDFTFLGKKTKQELFLIFFQNVDYDINLYKIRYKTTGVDMLNDTASGLLVVPIVSDVTLLPMVVYGHGTTTGPADVPSKLEGGYEVAMAYGGSGFITAAPDYLGLGDSRGFHPYVHAETEASASLDMLNASLEWLETNDPADWNPYFLFSAGYSQGGQTSMAFHREIENNWSFIYPITAATHMSGPYSMSGAMRDRLLSDVPYGSPAYMAYIVLGYNQYYDLYTDINEVFKAPYAATIDSFYNHIINLEVLNNKLIAQLSSTGPTLSKRMLQDTLLASIIAEPNHKFNLALLDNDTYNWAPVAPTRLYYCGADEQVPPVNATIAASAMQALGAPDVQAINLNPNFSHGTCVFPAIVSSITFFRSFLNGTATENPAVKGDELKFFPNPAFDFVSIDWAPAKTGFNYKIFNTNGSLVDQGTTSSSHLSMSKLPAGLYMILCTAGDETKMGRVFRL
ncbi:MAG TPA: T9SS type A sorting domain-containing protein [Saprospiraceae bacterium]|nr:T9SS type A sorting domain-containing protein [Saprospiraceae bacterium]